MAKRRPTIGDNPLDSVIPDRKAPAAMPPSPAATPQNAPVGEEFEDPRPGRIIKERLTIHLPIDLIDKIKDAVYWTPGLTLAGFAEEALAESLKKLEVENGKPFPRRKANLKGGRPLK